MNALTGCLSELSTGAIVGIAAGVVGVLLLLWLIAAYNGLVRLRMRVKNSWAQIDVQLKRRHDLIPNLVESVKGYMTHEKELLENVTRARSEAMKAVGQGAGAQSGVEGMLSGALGKLYVAMEAYPDLKSNTNIGQLMEELTATENRIAFARQHYNDSTTNYNTTTQVFPRNIVAGMFGFTQEALFEVQDAAVREAPKVSFK